jgi:hypothetical protein
MAAIFPPADKGGVPPGPGVVNGYTPANAVIGEGPLYASSDCTTIFTTDQLNALTSEILAAVDILGFAFNTNSLTNLGDAISDTIDGIRSGYVPITGATMTGPLILVGPPTDPNGAATKDYVDDGITALSNTVDAGYVSLSGDTMTGPLTLSGNPVDSLHAASKAYVDLMSIGDAPFDTFTYGRNNGVWVRTLADAPADNIYYARRNNVWTAISTGSSGVPEAPVDTKLYGRKNALWSRAVDLTGDVMTGDLTIQKSSPQLILDKDAAGQAIIRGQKGSLNRWTIVPGDTTPETGGNTGSDFTIKRYDDAGAVIGSGALIINRATGQVTLEAPPLPTGSWSVAQQALARAAIAAAPLDAMAYSGMQVNGNLDINQLAVASVILNPSGAVNQHVVDQWMTCGQNNGTASIVVEPVPMSGSIGGLENGLQMRASTGLATVTATTYGVLRTIIEGYRTSRLGFGTGAPQPLTVAFMCWSTGAGQFGVSLHNGAANRSIVQMVNKGTPGGWEYKTVTFQPDTTGTWGRTNGIGLYVDFCTVAGSSFQAAANNVWQAGFAVATSAQTNFMLTNGNVFAIAGIVLLPGTEAPTQARLPFLMRPTSLEIETCKRYLRLYQFLPGLIAPTASYVQGVVDFTPAMRASPSLSVTGPMHITDDVTGDYDQSTGAVGFMSGNQFGCRFNLTNFVPPLVPNRVHNMYNVTNKLVCDARLT